MAGSLVVRLKCCSPSGRRGPWVAWDEILRVLVTDTVPTVGRTLGYCDRHGDAIVTAVATTEGG